MKALEEKHSSELITKWENMGFINAVENKRNVSFACEFGSLYLLDNADTYGGEIQTLVFPAIIRIFQKIKEDLPIKFIFDSVVEIITSFNNNLKIIEKFDEWVNRGKYANGRDIEVEVLETFCEQYMNK